LLQTRQRPVVDPRWLHQNNCTQWHAL
jgi:hypothetical protein